MTQKAISLKFNVSTVLAIALGIMISSGAVYLTVKSLAEANQAITGGRGTAELPNSDGRLSRVHLLISR
jgi:hypothetical protein